MSIFFKQLSTLGLVLLLLFALVGFILECFAATSSWNKVQLSTCILNSNLAAVPDKKLYMHPNSGICNVASVASAIPTDCYLFNNNAIWVDWDARVGTGSSAQTAAATKLPQVYSITIASIFVSLAILLLVGFHMYKPESLSRWMTQLLTGIFGLLVSVLQIYTPTYVGTNVLSSAADWKLYYQSFFGITCANASSSQYIGGGCALMSFFCGLAVIWLSVFPSCFNTCFYLVDEGSGGGSGADSSKASLVKNDANDSTYVPPVV
jgi:hypothetical protein